MQEQLVLGFGEGDLLPFKKQAKKRLVRPEFSKDRKAFNQRDLTGFIEGLCNKSALSTFSNFLFKDSFPYKSLFLHGKSGVGKTELMMSLIGEFLDSNRLQNCKLFTGSDFIAERDAAIDLKRKGDFLKASSETSLFILDGLHQLFLSKDVVDDLILVLEQLKSRNARIVVLSSLPLSSVKRYSDRLEKLLVSFYSERIELFDPLTARKLFQKKLADLNISLSEDVFSTVVFKRVQTGHDVDRLIREIFRVSLLEAVDSLSAAELAKHGVIKTPISTDQEIDKYVSDFVERFGLSKHELLSSSRKAIIAIDRHITMHYLNKIKRVSLNRIAQYFDRDHTVVIYAVRKIEKELDCSEHGRFFKRLECYQLFLKENL